MAEDNAFTVAGPLESPVVENKVQSLPHAYSCTLTPELVAKAREELQEKPEWRLRDVQALRDMVLKDYPNLRTRLDDGFLLRFLRARKFDYDKALQLLVNYHASRRSWPEVFHNLRPSTIKHVLDSGFLTVLPQPDPDGRLILCLRPGKWRPSDYPFIDNIRAIYLTLEKLIQPEETQVNGLVILADYNGVGLAQASQLGPFLAKKVVGILQHRLAAQITEAAKVSKTIQEYRSFFADFNNRGSPILTEQLKCFGDSSVMDGFPIRIKAVNIINEPRIFKGIFAIIKPFLKEKMAQRFILHGSDLNSLCQRIPSGILPEEYGGAAGKLNTADWSTTLQNSEEEFVVEFCQPDPLEGVALSDSMLFEGEPSEAQCDDSYRGVRSQLYYCY